MATETSNARWEWVSLLERAVPFLHDEGAKYDDDGSNEPLELAREIETLLASLSSDESALSPASLAFDGGREATPCPHTRDTNCDCAAPPLLARVPFTVERPAAQQQQGQAAAWADEWRAAVAAKLSSYGLSEEAAAVFASSELDEYKAGLCDCAENDPVDMVDLMMGVARDAIEKWKIESAGRPFGHKNTAPPPSAPVGVEDIATELERYADCKGSVLALAGKLRALAQQPAVVDEGFVSRLAEALTAQDWEVDPDGDGSGIAQLRTAVLAAQQQGGRDHE